MLHFVKHLHILQQFLFFRRFVWVDVDLSKGAMEMNISAVGFGVRNKYVPIDVTPPKFKKGFVERKFKKTKAKLENINNQTQQESETNQGSLILSGNLQLKDLCKTPGPRLRDLTGAGK